MPAEEAWLRSIYRSAGQLAHCAHEVFLGGLRVDGRGVDVHVAREALDQADVARLAIEIGCGSLATAWTRVILRC